MKVYIAGKITGDANYRLKFLKAEKKLRKEGHVVITPARLPSGMSPEDYMRICIPMIDSADAVAFLPDWQDSKGAKIEHLLCEYCGKEIIYL